MKLVLGNLKDEGDNLLAFLEPRVGTKPTLSGGELEIEDGSIRAGVKPRHVKTYVKRFLHQKGMRKKFRVLVKGRELTVQEYEVTEVKEEKEEKKEARIEEKEEKEAMKPSPEKISEGEKATKEEKPKKEEAKAKKKGAREEAQPKEEKGKPKAKKTRSKKESKPEESRS